ncbi:MAG: Calx-beta domain-containing protein [Luteolibacter sp.]
MRLAHILFVLAISVILSRRAQAQFPASTSSPVFHEIFTGGTDSFDLNYQSITMVPYQSGGGGAAQTRYRYSVRPIRALPVNMADADELPFVSSNFGPPTATASVPVSGLPTILGIPLDRFTVGRAGEIVLGNSDPASSVTLKVLSAGAFRDSDGLLIAKVFYLKPADGRIVIRFNYSLSNQYDPTSSDPNARAIVSSTFQAEIFPSGMIRYSYYGVDATMGEIGLLSSLPFSTGADVDFSNSTLRVPDVIVGENEGSATVATSLDVNQTTTLGFQYFTTPGTAVATHDYSTVSATGSINTGTRTASFAVPLVNDSLGETSEDFTATLHATGNPDWIFAEPRITILDDDAISATSGPRIYLLGSRVFVLPPGSSAVTITGFKLLSISGGTLQNPLDQSQIQVGGTFSLLAGSTGLLASGPGVKFTVATIQANGATISAPVGFDLDGVDTSPLFEFTSPSQEVTEGRFASINVLASQTGASVSYEIIPVSSQPFMNGNGDYLPTVKPLVFESGMATIEIPVLADGLTEGTEEFMVRLVDPSPGSYLGPASRIRIFITDGVGGIRSPSEQRLPLPLLTGRKIRRNLDQGNFPGQDLNNAWRFVGEPFWRVANSEAWNVREGLHQIEFNVNSTASPLYMAPSFYIGQGAFGNPIGGLDVNYSNFLGTSPSPTSTPAAGSLRVDLEPPSVATATNTAQRGQWRRVGQTTWRDSGTSETNVPAVSQLIEFSDDIAGYHAPTLRRVKILSSVTSTITSRYQTRPATGAAPSAVAEPDLRVSGPSWTYIPIAAQTNDFTVSFEFKPSGASINTLIGLSTAKATTESALSAILRASGTNFQGWDATQYRAINPVTMAVDKWHLVEMRVNLSANTYQLLITPPTGAQVEILNAGAFRTAASELRYLSMYSTSGTHSVRSIRVADNLPSSSWKIIEFPDQTATFDVALEMRIQPGINAPSNYQFTFGLADGRPLIPAASFSAVTFASPANLGASGRYPPVAIRLHVDLTAHSYEVRGETNAILGSGLLTGPLTKANHLYISFSSNAQLSSYSLVDSILPPASAPPTGLGVNLPENWTHIPVTPQTGRFSLTCDIRPIGQTIGSGDLIDSVVGLSSSRVDAWNQISVTLRAKLSSTGSGSWDAHTGGLTSGTFTMEGVLPIVDGKTYHGFFDVDIPNQTYRIAISSDDGGPVVILEQGTFRQPATEIRYVTLRSVQGRLAVSNIRGPLPHRADSPPYFTGQIESPNGFGTGTVVADHAVLTTARLVFDAAKLTFTPGVVWRRSDGGYATLPDACEPSNTVLVTGYAAAFLAANAGTSNGDGLDVAVLAFRPLDIPESDNAPGGGDYSGFLVDSGASSWSGPSIPRIFPSFPVSGILTENRGKLHGTSLGAVTFSSVSNILQAASGIQAPPGSEGAAMFAQGTDKIYRPAAVCVSATGGAPRFRTIDPAIAEAIYLANDYQRQPGFLQALEKGGVYYIKTTMDQSTDENRAYIYSESLPKTATWTVKRSSYTGLDSHGGETVIAEPGKYTVTYGIAPPGFAGPTITSQTKSLYAGDTWHLPAVYIANPPISYASWAAGNYDSFEAASSAITSPSAATPWMGVNNLTAYAFGFDPKSTLTRRADPATWTPGYPLVDIDRSTTPPTFRVDCLRRLDLKLQYKIESSETLAGSWNTITSTPVILNTHDGWDHARWTFQISAGQPGRKFIRTRVNLDP